MRTNNHSDNQQDNQSIIRMKILINPDLVKSKETATAPNFSTSMFQSTDSHMGISKFRQVIKEG